MPNLPDHLLSRFSELVASETGLHFPRERWPDLERGVRSVASDVGAIDAETYLQQILSKPLAREEIEVLASALTVGETYFFREKRSFEILSERVLPPLIAARQENQRHLRIWSAGCCTGEEPYSIAITVSDAISFADAWNVEILATDIGRRALATAERGIYSGRGIASVNEKQLATHFQPAEGGQQVRSRLRKMVTFAQMNLTNSVYVGKMDVIFCMNVLIYFSEERRRELVQHFYSVLEPGGYLFLGHSESISKMPVKFQAIVLNDCILYRKPTAEEVQKAELVTEGRA